MQSDPSSDSDAGEVRDSIRAVADHASPSHPVRPAAGGGIGGRRWANAVVWVTTVTSVVVTLLIGRIEQFRAGFADEIIYRLLARNLLDHHYFGYSPGGWVTYRAPGFAFFDAGIRFLSDSQTAVRVAQAALAGLTIWLTAWIAARIFGHIAAALTALLLLATGTVTVYASFELSETLATVALVGAVALALAAIDGRSYRLAAAAGLCLGISALTRPQVLFLVFLLPLGIAVALRRTGWRSASVIAATVGLVAVGTIAPWTIRNAVRVHAFIPVAGYGGEALFLANNPRANGYFVRTSIVAPQEYARISALPEGRQPGEWMRLAFAFIREHPKAALKNWVRDGGLFIRLKDDLIGGNYLLRGSWRPPLLDDRWLWVGALAGGLVALGYRPRSRALFPALVVGYFLLTFMVFLPLPRFRHGIAPFLALYSGGAIAWAGSAIIRRLPRGGDRCVDGSEGAPA